MVKTKLLMRRWTQRWLTWFKSRDAALRRGTCCRSQSRIKGRFARWRSWWSVRRRESRIKRRATWWFCRGDCRSTWPKIIHQLKQNNPRKIKIKIRAIYRTLGINEGRIVGWPVRAEGRYDSKLTWYAMMNHFSNKNS